MEVFIATDNKTGKYLEVFTTLAYAKRSVKLSYSKIGEPIWEEDNSFASIAKLPNGDEIRITCTGAKDFAEHL